MPDRSYITYLYGILLGLVFFLLVRSLFSVYYTPGVNTLYNSPVTQQLFPNAMKKLFPTWGYNKAGMYDGQAFTFGQGSFWPESGKGYQPTIYASGGASPEGGMRKTLPIPKEVEVGWWSTSPRVERSIHLPVYDDRSQHVEYVTPVGHWDE